MRKQCIEREDKEQNQIEMICKSDPVLKMNSRSHGRSQELATERSVQGLLKECQIACPHVQSFIEPDLQGKEDDNVQHDPNDTGSFTPVWFPKEFVLLLSGTQDG
jgi:hypothetical protein